MLDAGLEEGFALFHQTELSVETARLHLRIEADAAMAVGNGHAHQGFKQGLPDATSAPGLQDGKPADVPIGQQATRSNGASCGFRQDVAADGVLRIPFQGFGNPLLEHENCQAHCLEGFTVSNPIRRSHLEKRRGLHAGIILGALRNLLPSRAWPALLLLVFLLFGSDGQASERLRFTLDTLPEQEVWAGLLLGDTKVGFAHVSVRKTAPAEYEISSLSVLALRMLGFQKRIEWRTRDIVSPDLSLLRFEGQSVMDGNRLGFSGSVEGSRLRVVLDNAGAAHERELPVAKAILPASAINIFPLLRGLEPGTGYRFPVFHPESMEITEVEQQVDLDAGVPGANFVVRSRLAGVEGALWLDARGLTVAETALGGLLRAVPEPEAVARAYADAAMTSDREAIIELSLVRTDRALPLPRRIERMVLRLEGVSLDLPSGAGQQCSRAGESWRCETDSRRREALDGDATRWLRPTIPVPSGHPGIVDLSREVLAGAESAQARITAILRWLDANIRKSGADAFSALDVLQTRQAECQGHSYLYAALARAAGIPTRIVNGLVYSGEHQGFLYHTWVESLVDGQWRAVDPTFGQDVADGTHVKVLEGEEYAEVAPMIALIGRIRLQVERFDYRR